MIICTKQSSLARIFARMKQDSPGLLDYPLLFHQVAEEISGVNQRIPYQIISLIKEFLINYINLTAADFSSLLYSALITTYLRLFLYGKLLFIFLPFL